MAALTAEGVEVLAPARSELDLADSSSVDGMAERLRRDPVDILVNNAGINRLGTLETLDPAAFAEMHRVDLEAPFRLMQAALPGMMARGWGRVVNVGSVWALVGRPGRGGYAAAKAGLVALSRVAALEAARHGVLVNTVCPGYIATELTRVNNPPDVLAGIEAQIPMGRLGTPEEVAALVAWLVSARNGYLTGQVLTIDGGYSAA